MASDPFTGAPLSDDRLGVRVLAMKKSRIDIRTVAMKHRLKSMLLFNVVDADECGETSTRMLDIQWEPIETAIRTWAKEQGIKLETSVCNDAEDKTEITVSVVTEE